MNVATGTPNAGESPERSQDPAARLPAARPAGAGSLHLRRRPSATRRTPGMLMRSLGCTVAMLVVATSRFALASDVASQATLTLEGAKRVASAAVAYARSHGSPGGAIAIVDAGGHTLYLERLDGTFAAASDVSIGKARTAASFGKPTRGLEESINKGRTALATVIGATSFTPLQGGIPIVVDGQIVGGIGVSGAMSQQQDEEIAIAGAKAVETPTPNEKP